MLGIRGHASTKEKEEKPLAWDEYAAWKQIPASYRERVKAKWLEEWGEGNENDIGAYVDNWLANNESKNIGSICDDVRFPNELEAMRKEGWITVRLEVNEDERLRRVKQTYGEEWESHWKNRFEESETSLDDYEFDWDYVFTDMPYDDIEATAQQIIGLITADS